MVLAVLVFIVDRGNKYWFVDIWGLGARGRVELTWFLDLVLVWNRGISYGLLAQEGETGRYLLFGFAIVVCVILVFWLARAQELVFGLGLGLIIGGAVSNAVDRLVYGAVADFFSLHAYGFYWYVFNLADVAIVVGVVLLLYVSFVTGHKTAGNGQ